MASTLPILQELPPEQDIGGASGAQRFYLLAYGKGNSEKYPYNVPNEKIACDLARVAGLPVPEGLLYQHRGDWLFLSRSIGTIESGEPKPPGTARDVQNAIAKSPGFIEEMVCFDLFVCNNDRNPGNIICDSEGQLWLIDYGNALFYRPSNKGIIQPGVPRLEAVGKDLDALFDKPYDFLDQCRDWEAMHRACERITGIPDYFIENTIGRLPRDLLLAGERDFAIRFLKQRQEQMEIIVRKNAHRFPNLTIPPLL